MIIGRLRYATDDGYINSNLDPIASDSFDDDTYIKYLHDALDEAIARMVEGRKTAFLIGNQEVVSMALIDSAKEEW